MNSISSVLRTAAVTFGLTLASNSVLAAAQWTCGSWMGGFTPAENNIARDRVPTGVNNAYRLTDGQAEVKACAYGTTCEISSGKSVTLSFDSPMIVREVRIYATWGDDGRDEISVNSVTAKTLTSPDAVTLSPGAKKFDYNATKDSGEYANYAYLTDDAGGALAHTVTSLTINFGTQENGYVGYPEIEVIGEVDMETPTLLVQGDPADGGTVEPAYGFNAFSKGTVSACGVWTNADASVAYRCAGWKLYRRQADGTYVFDPSVPNASGTGTTFDYTVHASGNSWKLIWQWAPTYHVTVTSTEGGTAGVTGETDYFAPGATATVEAVPTADDGYVLWTGDQPYGLMPTNRTTSFVVTGPTALKANFTGVTWVNDSAELTAALDAATSVIGIHSGDYQLEKEYTLSSAVVLQGAAGDPADVTVRAAAGKRRTFELKHADARVRGLTLKGTDGKANGVIYLSKGALENCRVTGGCVDRNTKWGAGVCNDGGTVRRCVIDGNSAGGNIFNGLGLCQKSGLTEYCVITNNTYSSWHGAAMHPCPAGAYVSGGTLRCTLIAHNTPGKPTESTDVLSEGFAVHLVGSATVDTCAIVDNTVDYNVGSLPTAAVFLEKSGGVIPTIINTIVAHNLDKGGNDLALAGEKQATASLLPSANGVTGHGNVFETVNTYVWKNGEFSLDARSAAVNSAQPIIGGDYVLDLYGRTRVNGSAMDMGPVELVASAVDPAVTIRTDSSRVYVPATTVFEAKVVGFPAGDPTYAWTIDGKAAGDEATLSVDWTEAGVHTIAVTVTNGSVSKSDSRELEILSDHIYLDASCENPTYPYATPETAATSWSQVMPLIVSGGTMTIKPGTYAVDSEIALSFPYRLQGEGSRDAIILRRTGSGRLVSFTHADATADNVTFSGGYSGNDGGTAHVSNGACVQNCNFFDGEVGRNQKGGGCLWVGGATVRNCTIGNTRKGTATGQGPIWYGLGVRLEPDGLVENCIITNVVGVGMHRWSGHAQGCAVHMTGGTLRNCLVANNRCTDGVEGTDRIFAAGVYQTGGQIVNCTITANEAGSGPGGYYRVGGTMVNSIVADNVNNDTEGEYGDANVAGSAAQGMTRCLTSAPCFKAPESGDFRLRGNSPAMNAGDWSVLGPTKDAVRAMTDLGGGSRLVGGNVDMGCYESPSNGLLLLVR